MVKKLNMLIKLSAGAMIFCIIFGGLVFYFMTRRFAIAFNQKVEDVNAKIERHISELSDVANNIKLYTNDQNIDIKIDNYSINGDSILIDFTVDTKRFQVKDKYQINENIISGKKAMGSIVVDAVTSEADFTDKEFYEAFISENFMKSYNLTQYYERFNLSLNNLNKYGYLIRKSELPKNYQINSFSYNDNTEFSLLINKENVNIIILSFNYGYLNSESSVVYMVVQ